MNNSQPRYATFDIFRWVLPEQLKDYFTEASLQRERYNRIALRYEKAPGHHTAPAWQVDRLIEFLKWRYPELAPETIAKMSEALNRLALRELPSKPRRKSNAGRRPKQRHSR